MPKKVEGELVRDHFLIFKEDQIWLRENYGAGQKKSEVVRRVLHHYIAGIKARAEAQAKPLQVNTNAINLKGGAGES